jgi:hypothetical protein
MKPHPLSIKFIFERPYFPIEFEPAVFIYFGSSGFVMNSDLRYTGASQRILILRIPTSGRGKAPRPLHRFSIQAVAKNPL